MSDFIDSLNEKGPFAFPFVAHGEAVCAGMTLRDYFAAAVLPQVYAGSIGEFAKSRMHGDEYTKTVAKGAYAIADAMLAARGAA